MVATARGTPRKVGTECFWSAMRPRIAFERIACEGGSARRGGTMMAFANATFALLTKGGSSCPQDDGRWIAEGANIRRQSRIYFANALRTTRSTLKREVIRVTHPRVIRSPKIVKKKVLTFFWVSE